MDYYSSETWVAIARNPTSGRGAGRRQLIALIERLRALGYRVRMFRDRGRLRDAVCDPQRRLSLRCIVGAGGDGTIAGLLNSYPEIPIATLPMGTENLFAKYLGISPSGRALAETIDAGVESEFDVGVINNRKFFLMVSAGLDADIVHRLDARRTGNISKSSYLQPIWDSWRKYDYPELTVTVDGGRETHSGALAMFSNLPCYAMQLPFAAAANANDGLLDLRLFQKGSRMSTISYLASVSVGRHESRSDVIALRGRTFQIKSETPVPMQADGDPCGMTPADVSISTSRATFIVPKAFHHTLTGNRT